MIGRSYWLTAFQRRVISIYMDKFGVDAGVAAILDFEQGMSLGKAMIKHKPRPEQESDNHEGNKSKNIQI